MNNFNSSLTLGPAADADEAKQTSGNKTQRSFILAVGGRVGRFGGKLGMMSCAFTSEFIVEGNCLLRHHIRITI